MRLFLAAALLAAVPAIAGAQTPPASVPLTARNGDILRDQTGARIGEITRIYPDGSVQTILASRFVVVPAATLSSVDGKVVTSLSRKEVGRLR